MRKPASPNAIDYSGFKFPKGVKRLEGKDLEALRNEVLERDGGKCQACGKKLLKKTPWRGHPDRYHLAHRRNKKMYGDSLENTRALCGECHRSEHGNKLPRKA